MKRYLFLLPLLFPLILLGQGTVELTGTVRDHATGDPLPFVNIALRKAYRGAMTNEAGEFRIMVPERLMEDTVQFSFIGYSVARRQVGDLVGKPADIRLRREAFQLAEAVVRPLTAEDHVRIAVERIPQNYAEQAAMAKGYYYELVTENDAFLKFEEAVTATYVPGISDTVKGHTSILHARAAKDVETLQFMQKRNMRKEKKAAKRGKEYEPIMEGDSMMMDLGGPSAVLGNDPVRDRPAFLRPTEFKRFRYRLEGIVPYAGHRLLVISFIHRRKADDMRTDGKLYIDEETHAFVAIEYVGEFVIPALLKPVIAMAGFGISNPIFTVNVHYSEHGGRWHVSSAQQNIDITLSTVEMFRKNDRSAFHTEQVFVVNELETEGVQPIPKAQRADPDRPLSNQALNNDPGFWDSFHPVRPKRLEAYLE